MDYSLLALLVVSILFSMTDCCMIFGVVDIYTLDVSIKNLRVNSFKRIIILVSVLFSFFAISIMFSMFYINTFFFTIKHLLLLLLLWPVAISDYCEMRIPNRYILIGLFIRALLLVYEIIFMFSSAKQILISTGIAIVMVLVIGLLCAFVTKGSVGMGDIKLSLVIGAFLGVEGLCYTFFVSVLFSFIVALFLLLSKRKKKKDVIPFAPFLLAGFIVSSILSGI